MVDNRKENGPTIQMETDNFDNDFVFLEPKFPVAISTEDISVVENPERLRRAQKIGGSHSIQIPRFVLSTADSGRLDKN